MVNKNQAIISILNNSGPVSGQLIANTLGISRVAVWKRIHHLKEEGFQIQSSPEGYQLIKLPDQPLAPRFSPSFPFEVSYKGTTISTMDDARESGGTRLFLAGSQSGGRGRRGRSWISPEGGVYATLLLHPKTAYDTAFFPLMLLSISTVELLKELFGLQAGISWPNDIVIGNSKIGGLLSELHGRYDLIERQLIGIGLNITSSPDIDGTASIKEVIPPESMLPPTAVITEALFNRFHHHLSTTSMAEAAQLWRSFSATVGRRVEVQRSWAPPVIGLAQGTGEDSSLIVKTDAGETVHIREGDCRLLREQQE